ncbi:MAG: glutathione S-transferase family protein [Solirubrobacteraceae bacterium]
MPTLVDDGFVLTQNAAIYGYIVDSTPGCDLFGDGSARQPAEATQWIAYVNSDLHPAFKPLFSPARYGGDGDCEAPVHEAALANIAATLELAEQRLSDREWLAGFRSPADAYLYLMLRWATGLGITLTPNLSAFLERIERDEHVRKVLADEELEPVASRPAAA